MDNKLLALAAVGGAYWLLKGRKQRNPQRSSLRRNPTRQALQDQRQALFGKLYDLHQTTQDNGYTPVEAAKRRRLRQQLQAVERKIGISSGEDMDNLSRSTRAGQKIHKKRYGYYL